MPTSPAESDSATILKSALTESEKLPPKSSFPDAFTPIADLGVTCVSIEKEGKNEVQVTASIAADEPGPNGDGNGVELSKLGPDPKRKTNPHTGEMVASVRLDLSWSVDHAGDGPSLNVEGFVRGKLALGATTFRVSYDVNHGILDAGVIGNDLELASMVQVYDASGSLTLPKTLPFSPSAAFFSIDIQKEFLVAKVKTEIGSVFLATGPRDSFGKKKQESNGERLPATGTGTSNGSGGSSSSKYVALFGAELQSIQIDELPLVEVKLSEIGAAPIEIEHLGIVAATETKTELDLKPGELSSSDNRQFNPPGSDDWPNLSPHEALDFLEKLEMEKGVSLMGEISIGDFSDTIVIPFYRPDEHKSHRHRRRRLQGSAPHPSRSRSSGSKDDSPAVTPHEIGTIAEAAPDESDHTDSSTESSVQWVKLQTSVGVLNFARIGAKVAGGTDDAVAVELLLDVSAEIEGFKAKFYGLGLRFQTGGEASNGGGGVVQNSHLVLQGIQVDFHRGGVQVGAGLLRTVRNVHDNQEDGTGPESDDKKRLVVYSGDAVMRAEGYGFSGIGSFSAGDHPSLFLFVFLEAPIGTPTIHVEEMAAGFGYNRGAESPNIGTLHSYPLIETMQSGEVNLREYANTFPVKPGNVWLGAGVKFSSWEMVNASVIPLLSAGTQPSVNVLGTASVKIPKGLKKPPILIALALEASFSFNTGRLLFGGELTPKTHIIFEDANFKGGFGLCTWLPTPIMSEKQQKKVGDYILTLGGYSPKLDVPSYYPKPPRIGYDVSVTDHVSVRGEIYAALTPSALMFGGTFGIVAQFDDFHASLKATVDVLMRWKPLHYATDVQVDVAVGVTVHFFGTHTIEGHIGADLHLEGPPVHGSVKIDFKVLSVTVRFGDKPDGSKALSWDEFKTSFLLNDSATASARTAATEGTLKRSPLCNVKVSSGLAHRYPDPDRKLHGDNGASQGEIPGASTPAADSQKKGWVVHPRTLRLDVETQVPSTHVTITDPGGHRTKTYEAEAQGWNDTLGVAPTNPPDEKQEGESSPIRPGDLKPTLTLTLRRISENGDRAADLLTRFTKTPPHWGTNPVPKSMWGKHAKERSAGPDAHVHDALTSVGLEAEIQKPDETNTFKWATLVEDDKPRSATRAAEPTMRRRFGDRLTREELASHVAPKDVPRRAKILDALDQHGYDVGSIPIDVHHLNHPDRQGFLAEPRSVQWTST